VNRVIAIVVAVAAFVAVSVPAWRHLREQPSPPPPALRLAFSVPDHLDPGFEDETLDAAISPDETEVVFVATGRGISPTGDERPGVRQLWRRRLVDERATPMPGTAGAQQPAWKPTGRVIAFFADGRLKQITLHDGAIHDLGAAPSALGATWLPDGALLYAAGSGPIRRLFQGNGQEATLLAEGDVTHAFPVATGAAGEFVYVAVRGDGRRTARLVTHTGTRDLTTTSGHAAMVNERLLHVRDGVLLGYTRDPRTGDLSPQGTPIALDVGVSAAGRALFAASPRLLLHAPRAARAAEIRWFDFSGQRGARVADAGDYWQVHLSPDDDQAAVSVTDPLLGALDIAVVPADGRMSAQRLTLALAPETDPVWAPDGNRVLFRSMEGGTANLLARRVGQGNQPNEVLLRSDLDETPTDWVGDRILFQVRRNGRFDLMVLDVGTGRTEPVAESAFNEMDARWSPDGRWIAYVSDESGRADVYVRRPDLTRLRVSFGGGHRPRWTRDGRALLFLRGTEVMRADLTGGTPPGTLFSTAQPLFDAPGIRDFDVAHRSDRILALLPVTAAPRPQLSAVLNWTSLTQ
jgi:eukaryotic-like serine/threonine-protein kinase